MEYKCGYKHNGHLISVFYSNIMPISIQLKKKEILGWSQRFFIGIFCFVFFFTKIRCEHLGVDFQRVFASLCIDMNISVLVI